MNRTGVGIALCLATLYAPAARSQNLPPVARLAAEPLEVLVGEAVEFSAVESVDPDDGPESLSFSWDFGDGEQGDQAEPTHAYEQPGAFPVTLTVADGAATAVAGTTIHVLEPVLPDRPARSGPLALRSDGAALWVVNPDSNSVSRVATDTLEVAEHGVCANPTALAFSGQEDAVLVVCSDDGVLAVLDPSGDELDRVALGHEPRAVAVVSDDGRILVSNQGENSVDVLDADLDLLVSLRVADGPRALAVTADGRRAFVSHFVTRGDRGRVTVIDLDAQEVLTEVDLVEDPGPDTPSSGEGFPNLLGALAVHPAGGEVWVGGLKSNSGRGPVLDGRDFVPTNRVRGFFGPIAIAGGVEQPAARIDTNNADAVSAIAFSPNGRYAYVTHPGTGELTSYDLTLRRLFDPSDGQPYPFEPRLDVGHAPRGVVVSSDGLVAYVAVELSRQVVVLDLSDPAAPEVSARVDVTDEPLPPRLANGKRLFHRSRGPRHSVDGYLACASCHPEGGHDGRTWDLTQYGEGLRNTIELRGRAGMGHGPVHWSANFDEIQDFENDIVVAFGGTGLADDGQPPHAPLAGPANAGRSQDLDDLAAYLATFTDGHRSPYRNPDGTLPEASYEGWALFRSDAVGCTGCHAPPRFTDSVLAADPDDFVLHDVGTLAAESGTRLGGPLVGLDTPSLIGLWDSAPYLHDGRAVDLRDVLVTHNPADRHGQTSSLSEAELASLEAYLLTIDGTDDGPPPGWTAAESDVDDRRDAGGRDADGRDDAPSGDAADASSADPAGDGCGCASTPTTPIPPQLAALLALTALTIRRRR